MRKKIIALCIAVILVCMVLLIREDHPGKKESVEEKKGLTVAVSQVEPLTPWKTAQLNSLMEAAAEREITLLYHTPQEETVSWQINDIKELFHEDIDYLILIPKERTGYDQVLEEAKQRGIPVILAQQKVEQDPEEEENEYLSYVGSDYFKEGELCANMLSEYFGIRACKIMVIQGEKSSFMSWDRYRGFMQGIRDHSNLYISKKVESSSDRLTAQKMTELTLAEEGIDFNAVFAPSDEEGLGVLQALKLAGVKPGKDMTLVSIEGIQDVLKAIIAQEYMATVKSDPEYGDIIFDLIEKYREGKTVSKEVLLPNDIYTGNNAEERFQYGY